MAHKEQVDYVNRIKKQLPNFFNNKKAKNCGEISFSSKTLTIVMWLDKTAVCSFTQNAVFPTSSSLFVLLKIMSCC